MISRFMFLEAVSGVVPKVWIVSDVLPRDFKHFQVQFQSKIRFKIPRVDLKTKAWSLAGKLNYARHAHTTFFDGQKFVVAGGLHWDKASVYFSRPKIAQVKNEVCTLDKVRLQGLSVFRTLIFILNF